MLVTTFSAASNGIHGVVIEIEAASQRAIPRILITGLPGDVIRESVERVRACLSGLGFEVPSSRIVVHLSPASAKKQGPQCDVAIAMAVLQAEGLLKGVKNTPTAFLGELTLDGRIQPIESAMLLLQALERDDRVKTILLPRANGWQAALIESRKTKLVDTLAQILSYLKGNLELDLPTHRPCEVPGVREARHSIDQVMGHYLGKRALQIALSGGHHLLLIGSPGVGKSMLASTATSLLPELSTLQWIEVVQNYHHFPKQLPADKVPPFRAPHHGVSAAGLLGGGTGIIVPGEVTLAHHGVLFLDEFPEFRRDAIEGLREPLQNGTVQIHRIGNALELPAQFTLIAAMNPCPCGNWLNPKARCRCPMERVRQYQRRISGPILDRIDLCVVLQTPDSSSPTLSSDVIRKGILEAIHRQNSRNGLGRRNSQLMPSAERERFGFSASAEALWLSFGQSEAWNLRTLHKIARVARTIADVEGMDTIQTQHIEEARALRCPDSSLPEFM